MRCLDRQRTSITLVQAARSGDVWNAAASLETRKLTNLATKTVILKRMWSC
jgi:hypothetical protein